MFKKIAFTLVMGAAALLTGTSANAAETATKVQASTNANQATDVSAQRRRVVRRQVYRSYRPYYRPYAYAPAPYYAPSPYGYYGRPRYYGGPSVSFGFGSGW